MDNIIVESGMQFIAQNAWHIENSDLMKELGKGNNSISSVEFIRFVNGKLCFIEAKSSFPNVDNPEKKEDVNKNTDRILKKYIDSLQMLLSVLNHVNTAELPDDITIERLKNLIFVLVIRDYPKQECNKIMLRFQKQLNCSIRQIWKPKILVINEEIAKQYKLVAA